MARERWPSRLLFIFAAVGSAAGLGNLWRFPYLTYEYGGGAFLIPYFFALIVLGIPLLILEFALGQYLQQAAVGSLRKLKNWGGIIAWWALGTAFIILSYYSVVMAWSLRYFFASFTTAWSDGAKEYFFNNALCLTKEIGILGGINWALLGCLFLVWIMIYFSIFRGVKSVSLVVKVTMPLPILLLIILMARILTLEGSNAGLFFYLKPTFSALLDPEVWIAAAGQIFFTLTLGFGVMIAYASYTDQRQGSAVNGIWTALLNTTISILAGFVVFGTLGFLSRQQGVTISEVATSGPGLAFVVFPEALSLMPLPWFFSLLFFIMLLSLGIDSAFSLIEGIIASFKDRLQTSSTRLALTICLFCFAAGIIYVTKAGLYFLDVVDHFIASYALILIGICQCLLIGWTSTGKEVKEHLAKQSKWFPTNVWWWIIRLLAPFILIILLISLFIKELDAPYEGYPGWAITIGWITVFLPLVTGWFLNQWYGKKLS